MTYSWKIGSTTSTTSVNTKTTQTLNANTAFTVTVKNTNGCTSAAKAGTITVTSGAASGQTANACGCASGLDNCSGICKGTGSANWTTCSGFTQVSNVNFEACSGLSWSEADSYCKNKGTGWRLPTLSELECMCKNVSELPGGLLETFFYWSGTPYDGSDYYIVGFSGVHPCSVWNLPMIQNTYAKCVK
jgi:hypothetical protein